MRTEQQAQRHVESLGAQLRIAARTGRPSILSAAVGIALAVVVVTLMMLNPFRLAGSEQES